MKKARRRSLWSKVKIALVVLGSLLAFGLVGIAFAADQQLRWAEANLPDLNSQLNSYDRAPSVIVSDDGVELYREFPERRKIVTGKDIPTMVILATEAAEDKRFMEHDGIDVWALGRILTIAASTGHASQGGSTITMQVVKNATGDTARTMDRKFRQMALATVLERRYSKEQILELYLNQSFYGQGAYGVAAAAQVYFGKTLDQLSIAEMATLARCVRSPTRENPITSPDKAKFNRDVVLKVMREEDYITEEQYQHAIKEELTIRKEQIANLKSGKKEPYFVDYILGQLRDMEGVRFSEGGYRVVTTLDTKMQATATEILRDRIRNYRGSNVNIGAFLCMDNEGRIQAMVNSTNYSDSQYNVPVQALLQPGSSFKPIVYATAFELGVLSPGGTVNNRDYMIRDRGGKRKIRGGGPEDDVSIRTALAKSYNKAALWAQKAAGLENVLATARSSFGFTHLKPNIETTALGSNTVTMLEMAEAYSVFQQRGSRVKPYGIKRIIGPDGTIVKSFGPERHQNAISVSTSTGVDRLLRAVVEEGTGEAAAVVQDARGKTGTTSDNKDAWFCGYTNRFVGVVWLANETRTKDGRVIREAMDDVDGHKYAAPTWAKLVGAVVERFGDIPLDPSDPMLQAKEAEARSKNAESDENVDEAPVNDRVPYRGDEGGPDTSTAPPATKTELPTAEPKPAPAPRRRTPDPRPAEPNEDAPGNGHYVYATVCADTGQLAASACPNRMRLPFEKGSEPTRVCQLHGGG